MKKILTMLLVVIMAMALLVACGGGSGSTPTETQKLEGNGVVSNHVHCVCAGKSKGLQDHTACSEKDGWVEISTPEALTNALIEMESSANKVGYFALTADIKMPGNMAIAKGITLNLCLNGHTMSACVRNAGSFNLTDCTGNGTLDGTKNATVYVYGEASMNIYGGNLTNHQADGEGRVLYVNGAADDGQQTPEGTAAVSMYAGKIYRDTESVYAGANVFLDTNGLFNLYNGTITGANVNNTTDKNQMYGGNISVYGVGAKMFMVGGEVTNGKNVTVIDGAAKGQGGNIGTFRGELVITGGKVTGGHAIYYGGNVSVQNKTTVVTLSNATFADGVAEGIFGGNLYINAACEFTMDKSTVINGKCASYGGNVFINTIASGTMSDCTITGGQGAAGTWANGLVLQGKSGYSLTLKGNMVFKDNVGGDIYTKKYASANNPAILSVAGLTSTTPITIISDMDYDFTTDTVTGILEGIRGSTVTDVGGKLHITPGQPS